MLSGLPFTRLKWGNPLYRPSDASEGTARETRFLRLHETQFQVQVQIQVQARFGFYHLLHIVVYTTLGIMPVLPINRHASGSRLLILGGNDMKN